MKPAIPVKRKSSQSAIDVWDELSELICEAGDDRGVIGDYPDPQRRLSLLEALVSPDVATSAEQLRTGKMLSDKLASLTQQFHTFSEIGNCPVVGITGMLNAGKSTLLATYLSPGGRRRVLRGVGNEQGTHRFVLWLPSLWWQQRELLSTLISFLASLFGHAPEQLSDDPEKAFAQYNGQLLSADSAAVALGRDGPGNSSRAASIDPLTVPLIASDQALNALGLGLLDCPDIQTGFLSGSASAEPASAKDQWNIVRQRKLARVGRLCSAFIVVSKFSSLHDTGLTDILTTLREAMPGVPRILAVNKVKSRYAPNVIHEQARGLLDRFGIQDLFIAYDYRSHMASTRIPPQPRRMAESTEPMPIFFAVSGSTPSQPVTTEHRYLHDLADQLDVGTLQLESLRSLTMQLENTLHDAFTWLGDCQNQRRELVRAAWQAMADACFEFMAERDSSGRAVGLRLQTSPAIIAQMSDSLCRQAPWSMRLSLKIDRSVRSLQQAVISGVNRLRLLQSATSGISRLVQLFRQGETGQVVTQVRLASEIERLDYQGCFSRLGESGLLAACDAAIARYRKEDSSRLDIVALDLWSQHVWKNMPLKKKLFVGAMPLVPIFAPLLAVTFIPFDGGGSAVLVFASLKELLAAAGIATMLTPATGGKETADIIQSEAAWTQLSDLFAVTCDSLGVKRPEDGQLPQVVYADVRRTLYASSLPSGLPIGQAAIPSWTMNSSFEARVRGLVAALDRDRLT